jgi:hypothetical protein
MMTNDDYQHFVCIVAGDNPIELMAPYDKNKKEEPYIKYRFKDARKIKNKYIEIYEGVLNNEEETIDKDSLKEIISDLKEMTIEEFYEDLTKGLEISKETGDAYSTENLNGHYTFYEIGKLFSVPFLTKDGREVFQSKKSEIDWDKIHLGNCDIYKRAWEMVMEDSEPTTDYEKVIFENMKDKIAYFQKFENKDNYVISSTAFWSYAFVSDKTGWMDASESNNSQFTWMSCFYDIFIKPLPDDTLLTIYECKR